MGLNIFLSHQPSLPRPAIPYIDKVEHLTMYGILAFLLGRAWLPSLQHRTATERLLLLVTACLLWGVGDEIHQSFIPGRSADPLDVLADVAGALLVAGWFGRRMKA